MKTVLVITYYWPPSGGGGVQRWVKFTKYMAQFNVKPIVLTVNPDYASYAVIDESLCHEVSEDIQVFATKSFEPFNLYKKVTAQKEIPFGGFANEDNPGFLQKFSRFIRGNFFIPDARVGWNKYAYRKAVELISQYQITTVITSSPPHSTQLLGLKLKKNLNIHWIADLRDPWTDIYYYDKMFHTKLAREIDKKKENKVLQSSDSLIVVSDAIKHLFASKLAIREKDKIVVIPNGFDADDFLPRPYKRQTKFVIAYTGTLADNYHIEGFLNVVNKLISIRGSVEVSIHFVGRVSEKYRQMISSSRLNANTIFVGHVDHQTSISYLQQADALFLAIPDVPENVGILTGKLFEYLASQKPVLGIGPVNGDAAKIIEECNAGQMFDYTDEKGMYEFLDSLIVDWEKASRTSLGDQTYLKYSRERLTERLVELIPQ
ncbi:MAG: glycosyltransferase family 4 protein [Bacteroidales bacterium]|nr:glycosyltransferase family 4 protein [Bacteroidales bacterium]